MPHARIKSIDASAALAMPGVKAILTADDVPGPKDQINDNGQVIRANPRSETALANEAMYQGQPVLAVCAVDELIAAEAIERIKIQWEPLPFNVDPVASLVPGAQNARVEGNVWKRPGPPAQGQPPGIPEPIDVKWNEAEADGIQARPVAGDQVHRSRVEARRCRRGFQEGGADPRRNIRERRTSAISASSRGRRWRSGRTASCISTPPRRAWRRRSFRSCAGST